MNNRSLLFSSIVILFVYLRAVAQLASARDSGSRGRRFKSAQPDHIKLFKNLKAFDYEMGLDFEFAKKLGIDVQ